MLEDNILLNLQKRAELTDYDDKFTVGGGLDINWIDPMAGNDIIMVIVTYGPGVYPMGIQGIVV